MAVDVELLESSRAFEDADLGVRERFLTPTLGGARTVALLTGPRTGVPEVGWVLCPSFGMEQSYLVPFEVSLARRLAAAGSLVLRYHGQGYGDSELPTEHVSLASHLRDAIDAVALLRREVAAGGPVGLVGTRFGAAVAAIVAGDCRADAVVLVDPVVSGGQYVRTMLGRSAVAGLVAEGRARGANHADATTHGRSIDVEGAEIDRAVLDEIASMNVPDRVAAFPGRSLIVQVSRSPEPRTAIGALQRRLSTLGGGCEVTVVTDPNALRFGLPRYRRAGGARKVDVQADLQEGILAEVLRWTDAARLERARGGS